MILRTVHYAFIVVTMLMIIAGGMIAYELQGEPILSAIGITATVLRPHWCGTS